MRIVFFFSSFHRTTAKPLHMGTACRDYTNFEYRCEMRRHRIRLRDVVLCTIFSRWCWFFHGPKDDVGVNFSQQKKKKSKWQRGARLSMEIRSCVFEYVVIAHCDVCAKLELTHIVWSQSDSLALFHSIGRRRVCVGVCKWESCGTERLFVWSLKQMSRSDWFHN